MRSAGSACLLALATGVLLTPPSGVAAAPKASAPTLSFRVFARTGSVKVDSILWTGTQFLYVSNTTNTVWSAPAQGLPVQQFATMPNLVEETRCILSPGTHGFPSGAIFCNSPDDKIYEISADGTHVSVFATLPAAYPPAEDGALAFDNVGKFGYRLVAATGRSGAPTPSGGSVYTIDPSGTVQLVGSYAGPGGADEVSIAPASFGAVAGEALLSVDPGPSSGTIVAMDAVGHTRTIATLDDGANPLVVIPPRSRTGGVPEAGLYLTDDVTGFVYVAPAAQLRAFAGDVIVGTETKAHFWIIEPKGGGFRLVRVRHTLRGAHYDLEQMIYVG
jgi:hypothetical protein